VLLQGNSAAVNNTYLADRFIPSGGAGAGVIEKQNFAGQGKLDFVFAWHGPRVIEEHKHFRPGIHPGEERFFQRQHIPHFFTDVWSVILQKVGEHGFARRNKGQSKMAGRLSQIDQLLND